MAMFNSELLVYQMVLWQDGVVGLPPKLEPNVAGHVEARDLQLLLSFWYKTQVGIASVLVMYITTE